MEFFLNRNFARFNYILVATKFLHQKSNREILADINKEVGSICFC
jgi:hypothetical protein